ncbi:MAG: hypothetical protein E6Q97_15885 [Desulfurellales bacterium]|nr:MAG: hypothetical protein E6Q97_15885 [Desulfurellales bacterium]
MNTTELLVMIERLLELEGYAYELRASGDNVDHDHFTRLAVWLHHAATVIDTARAAEAKRLGAAYRVVFDDEAQS